jgi:hypothetical protein
MRPRLAPLLAVVILCQLVAGRPALAADAVDAHLQAARQAWQAGQFAAAGTALDRAYRAGARNAALCLAAARAWRLAQEKGRVVLWLIRAHRLDPANAAARKALAAAGVDPPGPRLPLGAVLSPRAIAWLAIAANSLWWLLLALARVFRRRPPRAVLLASGLVVGWLWLEAALPPVMSAVSPQGVVLADSAGRCAPEVEAEVLFTLPAGQVVALGQARQGYRQVTAPGDRVAWLPVAAVAP